MKGHKMKYNGFFCYNDYVTTAKEVLTEEQYREYAAGLLDMGAYLVPNVNDHRVKALLQEVYQSIVATDRRYEKNKRVGRLGGRKRLLSMKDLSEAINQKGKKTPKALAEHFNCSVRTIFRYLARGGIKLRDVNKSKA